MFPSNPDNYDRTNPERIGFLSRPWQRIIRDTEPEGIFTLVKRNYNFYANISVTSQPKKQFVTVLETDAASIFMKTEELRHRLRGKNEPLKHNVNLRKESGKPVQVRSTIYLVVEIGKIKETVCFYVVDNIATAVILGCNFRNKYVDAIRPRMKIVRGRRCDRIHCVTTFEGQYHSTALRDTVVYQAE